MQREVLIDNTRVDVQNTNVPALVYNNPILFDLSQMKANRTTSYTVPLTKENRRLLQILMQADAESNLPYVWHKIDEYRDGLPAITGARGRVLTQTAEELSLSVTWGAIKTIAETLKNFNINDLPDKGLWWGDSTRYMWNNAQDYAFIYTDTFGLAYTEAEAKSIKYHFPQMRASEIMRLILAKVNSSVTPVNFPDSLMQELRNYWVQVTNNKTADEINYESSGATIYSLYQSGATASRPAFLRATQNNAHLFVYDTAPYGHLSLTEGKYKVKYSLKLSNTPNFVAGRTLIVAFYYDYKGARSYIANYTYITEQRGVTITDYEAIIEIPRIETSTGAVNVYMTLYYDDLSKPTNRIIFNTSDPLISATVTSEFQIWPYQEQVQWNSFFPVVSNLPKISALDFVKNMMFLQGWYAYVDASGVTQFARIDDLLTAPAYNLEPYITTLLADELTYQYSDYAQHNILDWLEDDTVQLDASGSIDTINETLAQSKEVFRLAFAASDSFSEAAYIPIFTHSKDEAQQDIFTYTGGNIKPRLLIQTQPEIPSESDPIRGSFTVDMIFANIIPVRYKLMQRLLVTPKVVNIKLRLPAAEVYRFNELARFTFWGQEWVQEQVTINGDGTGTGKFIHLGNIY